MSAPPVSFFHMYSLLASDVVMYSAFGSQSGLTCAIPMILTTVAFKEKSKDPSNQHQFVVFQGLSLKAHSMGSKRSE